MKTWLFFFVPKDKKDNIKWIFGIIRGRLETKQYWCLNIREWIDENDSFAWLRSGGRIVYTAKLLKSRHFFYPKSKVH